MRSLFFKKSIRYVNGIVHILFFQIENPAKLIRVYDRVGSIEEGKAANLVALDEECNVCRTYVKGMLVYEK